MHRIGDPINVLTWQRALATRPTLTVVNLAATRDALIATVQATLAAVQIPVVFTAQVSRQWHDLFDFTIEPSPVMIGDARLERIVELVVGHTTALACQAATARARHGAHRRGRR